MGKTERSGYRQRILRYAYKRKIGMELTGVDPRAFRVMGGSFVRDF